MGTPLRILFVEDSEDDMILLVRYLEKSGYGPDYERVETAVAMRQALERAPWDVILCDYSLPHFSGEAAIEILQEMNLDIPLIIISGAIDEETAVKALRAGAKDFIMKGRLYRLLPALERELLEAETRGEGRRAEANLQASEDRFRLAFENANVGICLVDTNGIILKANPQMSTIFGYPQGQMEGLPANNITDPEDHDISPAFTRKAVAGEISQLSFEKRYRHRDGRLIWGWVSTALVRDSDGRPLYFISHVQDITENKMNLERMRKALGATVQAIALMVETKDPYTAGHQRRVADLARAIACEMGLSKDMVDGIRMGGLIHDIGKIAVPAEILSKPAHLSDIEFSLIKTHPEAGYSILKEIEFPWPVAFMVHQHHERVNGTGYPQGLAGEGILLEARILAVADVVEAMATHRPYRAALGVAQALEEIAEKRETLYDPKVVDACLNLFRVKGYVITST